MHNNNHSIDCNCSSERNDCKRGPFKAIDASCPPVQKTTTMIPFSSGSTGSFITVDFPGLSDYSTLLGFGDAWHVPPPNGNIDLTNEATEAFSVPQAGHITAISASFAPFAVEGTGTIRAQVYRAAADSNIFSPTNAFVDLTPFPTASPVVRGLKNITPPVPINAGDLLLMVFSAIDATNFGAIANAMAGITIST